jgi:hypothetical protein
VRVTTRRPVQPGSTPGPTETTRPATPPPGTYGGFTAKYPPAEPDRICVSRKRTSAADTAITASPGPATGSGASPGVSTSGPPNWATWITRIYATGLRWRKSAAWSAAHSRNVRAGDPVISCTVCVTCSGSATREAQVSSAWSTKPGSPQAASNC